MKNIVFTNGCFDILHRGHIELFKFCKRHGRKLFVGIDSDKRVKELKGNNRPINSQNDRKEMLESIRMIDSVFIFDSREELEKLVKLISPDIMVVGSDYKNKEVIGSENSKSLLFFEKLDGYSTTNVTQNTNNR